MTATGKGRYPHQTPDGHPVMSCLDWSGRDGVRHWGGGDMRSCRSCRRQTLLVDAEGRPQHKACAEREADLADVAVREVPPQATLAAEAGTLTPEPASPAGAATPELELLP
jgi:hypothetical protein